MTVEELKRLITEWASVILYSEGNTEDAEAQAREALELIDGLNQTAITFAGDGLCLCVR